MSKLTNKTWLEIFFNAYKEIDDANLEEANQAYQQILSILQSHAEPDKWEKLAVRFQQHAKNWEKLAESYKKKYKEKIEKLELEIDLLQEQIRNPGGLL